ncbi:hypothetical protein [Gluconobacter kondonii]|uniref:hypothetical protein n=1 Tax=Gluconobacter kondonii TaxID=941463 RepID=UPI001B8AFA9B|nr:hypothetical protein [Gluconobacter kondonii]MBS1079267.1 hypothetical protein [Gluconobacter kondonii]
MSILHTLKRKLRSCRRQQDAVSAHDVVSASSYRHDCPASSYAEDFRKILTQLEVISARPSPELEPWVLAALERMESIGAAERLWKSKVTQEEKEAFSRKSPKEQEEVLNSLLMRVNVLRYLFSGSSEYVMSSPDIFLKVVQK